MNDMPKKLEMMSALADGQLRGRDLDDAVALAHMDDHAAQAWRTYHLIGDVLRSADLASASDDARFLDKLRARLEQTEAPAAVAAQQVVAAVTAASLTEPAAHRSQAANEANFRWKLVAGFASCAAVGAIGWSLLSGAAPSGASMGGQLAVLPAAGSSQTQAMASQATGAQVSAQQASAESTGGVASQASQAGQVEASQVAQSVEVAGSRQVMLRDPRLDELLSAHRQLGGTSALQMPAGFLRNATFEGPAR